LLHLHEEENKQRRVKKVCPFALDSSVKFDRLVNYGREHPINMEIVEFMHLLMDECTHMVNFHTPADTELIHVIAAKDDAYVLRDGVNDFHSLWPGRL
jgi:hypothetical protein